MELRGILLAAALLTTSVLAEPFPREALQSSEYWFRDDFKNQFRPQTPGSQISHRQWPDTSPIFGVTPHVITAKFVANQIVSINFLFLDSGTHFGYVARGDAKDFEKDNRAAFFQLYAETKGKVMAGLNEFAGRSIGNAVIGRERMLKQPVSFYESGDLVARFHAVEEQLIKVTFFNDRDRAKAWISEEVLAKSSRDRAEEFAARVSQQSNGDVMASDIPLLPQGDRAYCGISALAMAMQYLGLEIDTEDYAAAAFVRYGSTRGSKIREVYKEAAEEAGFRMSRATRFDFAKAKRSIDEGIPVLVWRHWNQERDFLHTAFARRYQQDQTLELPKPDAKDREMWPDKRSFTHATVITGYNEERRELIFTESWTERERNRRMRVEEMEGTAYYTFFLRL